MIALLGKYVRKLLLGLALAAQNRSQDLVAKLESIEEDQARGGNHETPPSGGKPEATARAGTPLPRPGGPPEHWVKLVKRYSPELLRPGSSVVVPLPPSQFVESETQTEDPNASDLQGIRPSKRSVDSNGSSSPEDLTLSFEAPGSESKTPPLTSPLFYRHAKKSPTAVSFRPDEVPVVHPKQSLDGVTSADTVVTQPKSISGRHPAFSKLGEKKTTRPPSSSVAEGEGRVHANLRRTATQEPGKQVIEKEFARSSQSTAGPASTAWPSEMDQKRIQQDSSKITRSQSRSVGVDYKEHGRKADPQNAFGSSAHRPTKLGTNYPAGPGPLKFFEAFPPSSASGVGIPYTRSKSDAYGLRDRDEVRKVEANQSIPPERVWPSLPGEDDSEVAADPQSTAYWPTLPADPLANVKPLSDQVELRQPEAELRKSERLQRLDEEQKRLPWSE